MDEMPWYPGEIKKRQFSGYSESQMVAWRAMEDMYYGRVGGWAEYRLATPGVEFDRDDYDSWVEIMEASYQNESPRDVRTRPLGRAEFTREQLLAWFERMCLARQLRLDGGKK